MRSFPGFVALLTVLAVVAVSGMIALRVDREQFREECHGLQTNCILYIKEAPKDFGGLLEFTAKKSQRQYESLPGPTGEIEAVLKYRDRNGQIKSRTYKYIRYLYDRLNPTLAPFSSLTEVVILRGGLTVATTPIPN